MPDDVMFQEAMDAVRRGQRGRARDLFTRLLRTDQTNPQYWLWMSAVVESLKEQTFCLQKVLNLEPDNRAAKQGLILLGVLPPDESIQPAPPIRRKWDVPLKDEPKTGGLLANPLLRLLALSLVALVVVGLILAGVFGLRFGRQQFAALPPTNTLGPSPTFSPTPTFLNFTPPPPIIATPIPVTVVLQPLWTKLKVTYTPTPIYVNTPHPKSEAFNIALRAMGRGDWDSAFDYMQQVSQVDPNSVDVLYYLGEIERQRGDDNAALSDYKKALDINPNFAPAYLGRARVRLALNRNADVMADLDLAIEKDPNNGEAYLDRAAFILNKGDLQPALADIRSAEKVLPASPLIPLYRARAALLQGDGETALAAAQEANQMDFTLLPAYLLMGQAALLDSKPEQAVEPLITYTTYVTEDPVGWAALGQADYAAQHYPEAILALDQALKLDSKLANAYLYRGLIYLARGESQLAVNEINHARQLNTRSFDANLGLGRAFLANGQLKEARDQLTNSLDLATTDGQKAQVFYWRAQVLETIGNPNAALNDWQMLLKLPKAAVPQDLLTTAGQHLDALKTPAARPSPSRSVPTKTFTPSPTVTKTLSPTHTP
jgi:tetratricopeptide (TPR) repeat protein